MDNTTSAQVAGLAEPPPLLATNFNEHIVQQQEKKGEREYAFMMNLCNEVMAKGRQHEGQISQLEAKFTHVREQEKRDRDDMSVQVAEVQRKVRAISVAIEHNLLYIPALGKAVEHITSTLQYPEITANNTDAITENCHDAIKALQGFSTGGVLPNQPLPLPVTECLHAIGRHDVLVGIHPSAALLAYCNTLLGRVSMKGGMYDTAESYFLQAMKADETQYPGMDELVRLHQQAMDMQLGEEQPTTPRSRSTTPRRQHFFTPPPARSMHDIEGDLPRGAVTPGTGHWNTDTSSPYLSFARPWATESPSPTTVPPPRPKVNKQCYNCKSTENLKMCSGCKKVCFCSVDCQKKAWEVRHSEECEGMANTIGASSITA